MASSLKSATFLIESRMADAARGDGDACYDLGITYSSGSAGIEIDLVQAHKWFNLAALNGNARARIAFGNRLGHDRARNRRSTASGARMARRDDATRGLSAPPERP